MIDESQKPRRSTIRVTPSQPNFGADLGRFLFRMPVDYVRIRESVEQQFGRRLTEEEWEKAKKQIDNEYRKS